ncbi:MAG: FAD-dependent oxidoreductase [Bauldia sp.]|uniref:FAD-dependent oxidoreductase n=1 Tax=Bauldia sp. TaxID=2575872 RepID=UPI001D7F7D9D|nr:FAD-dependent oxidoreductase [Bauldia sp.]MCB1496503.1 FAD-dependent oxidoreductase [Bauldia sp.]
MLTTDDLRDFPFFSDLSTEQLADIAKHAADISLETGQYAAHRGEDPAFFAVLSGQLELTRVVDGVEQAMFKRPAGQMYGEVQLTYGVQFIASVRATEPTRVLRLDAKQYARLAADAPEFARKVRELAEYRITGPTGYQGMAAEQRPPQVTLYGSRWGDACLGFREFLNRNQISFDWVTPDEADAASRWKGPLPADADGPVLQTADGTTLANPSFRELAERLGLHTEPEEAEYDTVIIGGGPAGLAAAVYGASEGLRTILVECQAPGGQAGTSSRIENYLGFPHGISGDELANRALHQAGRLGAEIVVTRRAVRVDAERRAVILDGDQSLIARTAIIATGVGWRRLVVEGFDRLTGKGIYYGAARSEAPLMQGLDIHLIGAGNSAGQAALFFANHARSVTLLVRGDSLEKSMSQYLIDQLRSKSNIKVALGCEVRGVHGTDHLAAIDIVERGGDATRQETCGGLFVFIGADAETGWLPAEIARDPRGFVLTGPDVRAAGQWSLDRDPYLLETSLPGFFACGDVRFGPVKRVAAAVGEGSMAIAFVHQYLREVASGRQ